VTVAPSRLDTRHRSAAAALVGSVVGVGALFLPASGVRLGGALAAWTYHLVAGGLLVAALSLTARAHHGGPGTGPEVVRFTAAELGAAGCAVRWYYLVGITVGQAVVATVGGWYFAWVGGRPGAWPVAAALILMCAAAVAASGWRGRIGPPAGLLAVTMLGALLVAGTLPLPDALGTVPGGAVGFGVVTFTLSFAFVGWESAIGLAGEARPGAIRRDGLAAGVAGVAVAYLVLAGLAGAGADLVWPQWIVQGGAVLAGMLCALACVRNLATVAALGAGAAPAAAGARGRRHRLLVAAATAGTALALIAAHRLTLIEVLSVPNAMALAVFCTAAVAVLVRGPAAARACAAPALLGYALLVPFGGLAVLGPVVLLLAGLVRHRVTGRGRRGPELLSTPERM